MLQKGQKKHKKSTSFLHFFNYPSTRVDARGIFGYVEYKRVILTSLEIALVSFGLEPWSLWKIGFGVFNWLVLSSLD